MNVELEPTITIVNPFSD